MFFIQNVLYLWVCLIIKKTKKMDKIELLKGKIKDLEWAEDYHQRKLSETEFELHLFRTELKNLE